ncbi:hypothetical protein L195_g007779 [Trifolium pratense]|uniref:Uncharacterized protein n=1 Tax=Trifolium pratense TaxID=57577 RepID=A0A2K3P7A5_TRIPR|nr:hypothetical protein L195_g007779 [Trifolium pratense]
MGEWIENEWRWSFDWRRRLFVWEEGLFEELLAELMLVIPRVGEDCWVRTPDDKETFSVCSAYTLTVKVLLGEVTIHPRSFLYIKTCGGAWRRLRWQHFLEAAAKSHSDEDSFSE